ncbi:MAG: hypothetical protein P4M13_02065, partial [Alphaproteobacteria bacterium]|nr:hypothetical protein [Alphaproteobacteria bacterium]
AQIYHWHANGKSLLFLPQKADYTWFPSRRHPIMVLHLLCEPAGSILAAQRLLVNGFPHSCKKDSQFPAKTCYLPHASAGTPGGQP